MVTEPQPQTLTEAEIADVLSRGGFLKKTGALAGVIALFGATGKFGLASASAGTADTTQGILNAALTAEQIATSFYYQGIAGATASQLGPVHNNNNLNYFQAALWEEYQHIQLLKGLGGLSLTGSDAPSISFPNGTFEKADSFLGLLETLERAFIGAYLAAVSYWASESQPVYAEGAAQIMGVEAEHRTLGRVAAGINPPNNLILEEAVFANVSDAVPVLLPFVTGGSGFTAYAFPTDGQIRAAVTSSIISDTSNPAPALVRSAQTVTIWNRVASPKKSSGFRV